MYTEEEKELANKLHVIYGPVLGISICLGLSRCAHQWMVAAGYRKIDPEKLTIISQDEANAACLKRDSNRPYPKGSVGCIEVAQTMLEAQLAHTKRQLQDMGDRKMNAEEFEAAYCERGKISRDFYRKHYVTLPCACGADICEGWAKVPNNKESIDDHNRFYAPTRNGGIE